MTRRHDIDTLRCLAFALVMVYHVAMAYVDGWHWHVKSPYNAAWLQWPMQALNLWRMDLVFLVSGLALGFLLRRESRWAVLRQRSLRLLLPLAWGMAVIVPYQAYAQAVANGSVAPGLGAFLLRYMTGGPWPADAFDGAHVGVTWNHLWFLPYLWLYTVLALVLLPLLRLVRPHAVALRGARLVLAPLAPLLLYALVLRPHFPPTHDLVGDAWLHALYGTLFVYGWWIGLDEGLWAEIRRLRRVTALLALAAFGAYAALRSGMFDGSVGDASTLVAARMLAHVYKWSALLAILGLASRHLDRPWRWLDWARASVYPWYVLHQTLIIAALAWLMPLHAGPVREPILVLLLASAGCWLLTDGWIRGNRCLRPLFGLGPQAPTPATGPSPWPPARPRPAAELPPRQPG